MTTAIFFFVRQLEAKYNPNTVETQYDSKTHKALKLSLKYHDNLTNKKPTYRKNAETHGMANISDNTLIFITKKPSKSLTNLSIVSC